MFYKLLEAFLIYRCLSLNYNLVYLLGRIYLGMHSLVDVIGGLAIGLVILAFWLTVHEHVDVFIVSGQNGKHTSVGTLFFTNILPLVH